MSSCMMPSPAGTSNASANGTPSSSEGLPPKTRSPSRNGGCYFTRPYDQATDVAKEISGVALDKVDSDTSSKEREAPTQSLHAFVGLTTRAQFEALEAALNSPGDANMFPIDGLPEVWYHSPKSAYRRVNDMHGRAIRRNGEIEYNVSWCQAQYSKTGRPFWKPLPGEYDTWIARGDLAGARLVGLMNLTDTIIRERAERERKDCERKDCEKKDCERKDCEREDCETNGCKRRELRREQEMEEEAPSPRSDWASTKRKWQGLGRRSTDMGLKQINESTLMKRRATAAAAAATEASQA